MSVIKQFLSSKKAIAAVAGVLVLIAGRIGLDIPADVSVEITGIVIAYLLGQGLADVNRVPKP